MKLSIIIPVYNVESTLERCIRSVFSQSFQDYELILVDDGSTDRSGEICDHCASGDSRIKIIHQKNTGLSGARNSALDMAKGEYITFIDSDDFLAQDTYQPLMEQLLTDKNIDMLEYSIFERYGSSKQSHKLILPDAEYTDMKAYWLKGKAYRHTYACNKIFRRELFRSVRFPMGKAFEDAYTLPLVLEHCNKAVTTSKGLYYYCWNETGITATAQGTELNDLLEANKAAFHNRLFSIIDTPLSSLDSPEAREIGEYYAYLLNIQLDVYEQTGKNPILPVLPYYNTYKLKIMHLIGMKNICKLNKLIHKVIKRR